MIKLGGLVTLKPITEADVFTATSKETGTTSVFKSKDARDAAIKAGTHEKRKDDKDGAVKDPTDKPKVNIFNKDKEEPKKDKETPKTVKGALVGDSDTLNDFLDDNESKFSKEDFEYLKKQSSEIKKLEDELAKAKSEGYEEEVDEIESDISLTKANIDQIIYDMDKSGELKETPSTRLKDLLPEEETFTAVNKKSGQTSVFKSKASRDSAIKKGTHSKTKEKGDSKKGGKGGVNIFSKDKEEPKKDTPQKDTPQKDSTGGRAGNIEVNKAVRLKTKRMGITPKNLGKDEYQRRMSQAAVEALTDSNFHSEARKLIAMLEDNPEFAKNPNLDPNKPDIMSPEYDEWRKSSVYGSEFYDSSPGTDEIGQFASQESSFDGRDAIDAIAFDLKLNGSKELALKMQSIFDEQNESSTKLGRLLPEGLLREGTRSQVGIIDRSGKIASIYVHYDGYPRNMKPALKKHMKNEKDVLKLIKMGGASGIYADKPEVPYYKKGNGMKPLKGSNKDIYGFIDKTKDSWAEYLYLYNMKDRKWYYADTYKDKELKKLF